jgi:uncharacterized membrane protein (UPF0127 family)
MPVTSFFSVRVFGATTIVFSFIFAALLCMAQSTRAEQSEGKADQKRWMAPITLGKKTIRAVVANTDSLRIRGLLGWERIDDTTGMLLDFEKEGQYAIHMQGMKFPIDAVWMDRNGVIRTIYAKIKPNSGKVFPALFPARYCLEVNAGFCGRYGVKTGQRVRFGARETVPR